MALQPSSGPSTMRRFHCNMDDTALRSRSISQVDAWTDKSQKFRQDPNNQCTRNRGTAGRNFEHRAVGSGYGVLQPDQKRKHHPREVRNQTPTRLTRKVRSSVQYQGIQYRCPNLAARDPVLEQTGSPKAKDIPVKGVLMKGIPVKAVPMRILVTSMPYRQAISVRAPPEVPVAIRIGETYLEWITPPENRLKFHREWSSY